MTCKYEYNGLTFNSELELDEYLLFHNDLRNKLGDAAFKKTENSKWSEQQNQVHEALEKASDLYEKGEKSNKITELSEEGEPSDLDPIKASGDYRSITDIIHQMKGPDGNPVFPVFVAENYWEGTEANPGGQKQLYRDGKYDDPKIQAQLPFIDDLLPKINGIPQKVTDEDTLNKIEERMTDVWKQQALCGDLIHNIMSDFFKSKTDEGVKFKNLTEDQLNIEFEKKLKTSYYSKFKSYITPEIRKSSIKAAIKIYENIKKDYGEDCIIYSEKKVVGEGSDGTNAFPVVGRIDLMVVSRDGRIGILDFKCSPKDYTESNYSKELDKYDPAKVLTFKYQLAAYRRLLQSIGIEPNEEMKLGIIPLKFENFGFDNNTGKVQFSEISMMDDPIQELSNTSATKGGNLYNTIENNLEQVFPRSFKKDSFITGDLLTKVAENSRTLFKIKKSGKNMSKEDIAEMIKEAGGIKKNKITQNWEFKLDNKNNFIASGNKSKEEAETIIFNKIVAKYEYKEYYVPNTTSSIRKTFKSLGNSETEEDFLNLASKASFGQDNPLWIKDKLGKYTNTNKWKLISDDKYDSIFDQLGILMFRNKYTGLIDVIRISDYFNPTQKVKFSGKNRTTLLGTFLTDDVVNSDSNNQVMAGVGGNIELQEVMLLLNEIPGLFNTENKGIGNIEVISPRGQKGITATNEQLLYNFKRLCSLGNIKSNFNFDGKNGKIRMVNRVDACRFAFEECLEANPEENGLGKIAYGIKQDIKRCISDLDDFGANPILLRQKLIELDKKLTGNEGFDYGYKNLNQETANIPDENSNPEYLLHRQILYAIAQLSDVNLLQQIEDHAKFQIVGGVSSFKGVVGTMTDNPGTLQSETLNEFTDQVTKAYQNVRDNVIAFNQELRKKVETLKEKKGFGKLQQYTTGNQVQSLYINMYDESGEDLLFKNPWDNSVELTDEERDFLKFALLKINDNRIKNFNPNTIEEDIKKNPKRYLRVPLTKGDLTSEVAVRHGWLNFIRSRFAMLAPKNMLSTLKRRYDADATGLVTDDKYKEKLENGKFWEAINNFDATDGEEEENEKYRLQILSDEKLGGKAYFEHNLETLLLKHTSAYKMADELNSIFPVLRALTLHLNMQGGILNESFKNDIEYILTYIKTRVHNRPVEDRDDSLSQIVTDVSKVAMSTASKLALAFNPRQWYQFIDGLWKDITLFIKYYNNDDNPFTREGLFKGWSIVMQDLLHFGNDFTMSELLNQQYGFNDMDANSYIDRIKTDNTGLLYHFWGVGFRFASRPDFYNRMTLFYAQMHKDGSLEAHKVVDGKLVYDWTKDKRFDIFAKYKGKDSSVPPLELKKYNEQKSLYITMARQFELEGAKYSDGTLFTLDINNPKALPKAYTNQQSESAKALSDRIYGYYAHEKKSLLHSYTVGAMFMQMNTYWSAKKNQYAQVRSYTQEGKLEDYEEDGPNGEKIKYCWTIDEDGDLIPKRIEKPEDDTGVAVQTWKRRPQEGIMVTMWELARAMNGKSDQTTKSGIKGAWYLLHDENVDPELRRLYNANLRQLFVDLIIWLLIGNLMLGSLDKQVKQYVKETGNKGFGNAIKNNTLTLTSDTLKTSTDDANFIKSIAGRGKDWTPFAIKSADRLSNNVLRTATGKQDLFDFMVKSSGMGKSTEPVWESVKLELTDRKIGERELT